MGFGGLPPFNFEALASYLTKCYPRRSHGYLNSWTVSLVNFSLGSEECVIFCAVLIALNVQNITLHIINYTHTQTSLYT